MPCRHTDGLLIHADASHVFCQGANDWGFSNFFAIEEMENPHNGWMVNDTVLIRVQLTVEQDTRYNLEARKETGERERTGTQMRPLSEFCVPEYR